MIVLIAALGLVAQEGDAPGGTSFERLDAMYRENLEAIPDSGILRFSHRYHQAPPRGGEEQEAPDVENEDTGAYAFDGPLGYFEQSAPLDVLRARFFPGAGGARWPGPPFRVRAVTDGRLTLVDKRLPSPGLGPEPEWDGPWPGGPGPAVSPGTGEFSGSIYLPVLGLGGEGGLAGVVRRSGLARGPEGPVRVSGLDEDADLDGLPVVSLSLEIPDGSARLWVDPARGALPVRVRIEQVRPLASGPGGRGLSEGGVYASLVEFEDIRRLPGGAWLPFREVVSTVGPGDDPPSPRPVRTTTITEADFGGPPPRSAFRLDYADPVSPRLEGPSLASAEPRRVWDLDAMAGLDLDAPDGTIPKGNPREAPGAGGRLTIRTLDAAVGLSAVALLAVLAFRIARRGRDRPS